MKTRGYWFAAAVVCFLAFGLVGVGRSDEKPEPKDPPKKLPVMQRKLTHSHAILEGLAKKDFAKIEKGAEGLIECVNEAGWKLNESERYKIYSDDFRRRGENLKKSAKDKNIDAAALGYVDLTLTCVRCHEFLRADARAVPDVEVRLPLR